MQEEIHIHSQNIYITDKRANEFSIIDKKKTNIYMVNEIDEWLEVEKIYI